MGNEDEMRRLYRIALEAVRLHGSDWSSVKAHLSDQLPDPAERGEREEEQEALGRPVPPQGHGTLQ